MELSEYMVKRIKDQPDKFYLIMEPELVNVSFWYIPVRLRKVPHSPSRENELGKVRICNQTIKPYINGNYLEKLTNRNRI